MTIETHWGSTYFPRVKYNNNKFIKTSWERKHKILQQRSLHTIMTLKAYKDIFNSIYSIIKDINLERRATYYNITK